MLRRVSSSKATAAKSTPERRRLIYRPPSRGHTTRRISANCITARCAGVGGVASHRRPGAAAMEDPRLPRCTTKLREQRVSVCVCVCGWSTLGCVITKCLFKEMWRVDGCLHTRTCARTRIRTHAHIHTHIHTHTRTRTRTHRPTPFRGKEKSATSNSKPNKEIIRPTHKRKYIYIISLHLHHICRVIMLTTIMNNNSNNLVRSEQVCTPSQVGVSTPEA